MFSRTIIVLLIACLSGCASSPQPSREPVQNLRFGLLTGATVDQLRVSTETRVIPKRAETSLPYYGFELFFTDSRRHQVQTIAYPPGPPAKVKGNLTGTPDDYATGIRSRVNTFVGIGIKGYRFNEGDPLGRYKIVLLIDGSETQTIEYDIVDDAP